MCRYPINDANYQYEPQTVMKIGCHDVKKVTHRSAEVGCTRVTRRDVEKLLALMNAKEIKNYENDFVPNYY